MSVRRPSERDRLEAEYLRQAELRSKAAEELARMDARLVAMQRELERAESPRLRPWMTEVGAREDGIDRIKGGRAEPTEAPEVLAEDLGLDEFRAEVVAGELARGGDWERRCARVMAFAVGMLRRIAHPKTKNPRFEAMVGLFAVGADCESMRATAETYGVTVEWVSQRAEETRRRFNLPNNQHNKSASAVASYVAVRELAKTKKEAA
jgi:hypothetical protein